MKLTSMCAAFMLFLGVGATAQTIEQLNVPLVNDITHSPVSFKSVTCGPDTVTYPLAKASGLTALSINNVSSAQAACQYYDAPQAITISGLEFYGWKSDATGGITINITASVYLAGSDSMPTGSPLATTMIAMDTVFGGGSLSELRKVGTFSPITVTAPYVVVLENNSANNVAMIFNDYAAADGLQEWLCSINIGGNWFRSYGINVGGNVLDADLLVHPVVSYTLGASYNGANECLSAGPTVLFTNTSSPVIMNRMYNQAAFLGMPELSFTWNYGDGSATENVVDGLHVYSGSSNVEYSVTLTDTLFGWTSTCVHDTTGYVGDSLDVDFSSNQTGSNVNFTNLTYATAGASGYLWDFGDGNTSTQTNPTHTYASDGVYTVCLTAISNCTAVDSTCHTVTVVSCGPPTADFTYNTTDGISFNFTNTSATTGTTTYAWSMGDGTNYSTVDASHTYGANGVYTVVLIVSDSCGIDSMTQLITVAGVGLSGLDTYGVRYFPNPVNNELHVQGDLMIEQLEMRALSGQVVWSGTIGAKEAKIETGGLAEGQYLVRATFADGSSGWTKVLIKH